MSIVTNYLTSFKVDGKYTHRVNAYEFYSSICAKEQIELFLEMAKDFIDYSEFGDNGKSFDVGYGNEVAVYINVPRGNLKSVQKVFTSWRQKLRLMRK